MKNVKWVNLFLELLVVIFGVTIAFALNNWNENKKSLKLEQEYLMSFKNDLEKDTADLAFYVDTLTIQRNYCNRLIHTIYSDDFENDSLLNYSLSLFFVTSFIPHSATYKSITYSGQLQAIKDFDLRKRIVDLYDIDHAEVTMLDNFNKDQVFDYRTPFLHDNIQYNYKGIVNTEIMKSSKYINITMSTYYFLNKKIRVYAETLEKSRNLIKEIELTLN